MILFTFLLIAQLPASGSLRGDDARGFREYVDRQLTELPKAADQAASTYEIAKTYAAGKQWPEAVEWLRKTMALHVGIDPSRDAAFSALRGTKEFAEILASVQRDTTPVSHSKLAFQIAEGDLMPESVAYDSQSDRFFFGSMSKGKVIRCSALQECSDFATGLGVVLGLKADRRGLWVLSNSDRESSLIHFNLATAQVIRKYTVGGEHSFNDLTIGAGGEIYLTDTRANAVWKLADVAADLVKIEGTFPHANGIAQSPDGRWLYVSTYPDGLTLVDLKSGALKAMPRPAGICLAAIDGLYFYKGALIAIQNAFMSPRVVRLRLSRGGEHVERMEVLERRNPSFDGVTTGVIARDQFYYMANIQDDKKSGFEPIRVLTIHLGRE